MFARPLRLRSGRGFGQAQDSGSVVLANLLCAVFPRVAGKNRTQLKRKYRSAEGSARYVPKFS
jgi:hypothetical protein